MKPPNKVITESNLDFIFNLDDESMIVSRNFIHKMKWIIKKNTKFLKKVDTFIFPSAFLLIKAEIMFVLLCLCIENSALYNIHFLYDSVFSELSCS